MKDKPKKERTVKNKMAIMTAECDRMFSVDKEQIKLFKSVEGNKKNREKAEIAVSKISKKITVESKSDLNDKT